jgi:stringent starvation protein B
MLESALRFCAFADAERIEAFFVYRVKFPGVQSPFTGSQDEAEPTVTIRLGSGYVDSFEIEGGVIHLKLRQRGAAAHLTVPLGAIVGFTMAMAIAPGQAEPTPEPPPGTSRFLRLV